MAGVLLFTRMKTPIPKYPHDDIEHGNNNNFFELGKLYQLKTKNPYSSDVFSTKKDTNLFFGASLTGIDLRKQVNIPVDAVLLYVGKTVHCGSELHTFIWNDKTVHTLGALNERPEIFWKKVGDSSCNDLDSD